uniref:Uncharacterized protein n=1 Tax=Pyrodinium bahamense TaxID=73915 RepID=A0A7S0BBH2_9DINO
MAVLIDAYCTHFNDNRDVGQGVQEWNRLQALLRKTSRAVMWAFLLLQITALAMMLFSVSGVLLTGVSENWMLFSDIPLILSVGLVIFKAAEVTEKCSRVPSWINSLSINDAVIDSSRHYLVEYVTYSSAGFYVGELRLTSAVALKLLYVSGLAAMGLLTKLGLSGS